MSKDVCDCTLCFYKDDPECKAAYLKGYIEASDEFLSWAKRHNVLKAPLSSLVDSIETLHTTFYENNLFYKGYLEDMKEKGDI